MGSFIGGVGEQSQKDFACDRIKYVTTKNGPFDGGLNLFYESIQQMYEDVKNYDLIFISAIRQDPNAGSVSVDDPPTFPRSTYTNIYIPSGAQSPQVLCGYCQALLDGLVKDASSPITIDGITCATIGLWGYLAGASGMKGDIYLAITSSEKYNRGALYVRRDTNTNGYQPTTRLYGLRYNL